MEVNEQEIGQWFSVGKKRGWSHMVILVNKVDQCTRPIYLEVVGDNDPKTVARSQFSSDESILEVYNLNKSFKQQVRSFL